MVGDNGTGPRANSFPAFRKDQAKLGDARGIGMQKYGQADCRSGIRYRGRGDLLRVLRRPGEQSDRERESRSGERIESYDARACGRGGANYSVELSAVDGGLEVGTGDCGGLLLRTEA